MFNRFTLPENRIVIAGSVAVGALVALFTISAVCAPLPRESSVWSKGEEVSEGYVLIAPYFQGLQYDKPGQVLLLNEEGRAVHTWHTKYQTLATYLQPSGHIYVAMTPPIDPWVFPSPGTTGLIQELDWEGNVVWEYADTQMTHDFEIMPDGGVAYVRWSKAPSWFASGVRGGMASPFPGVWTNELVVVNRDKQIVWSWSPEEHMSPSRFVLSPLIPRHDWAHINSVRYIEKNPLTGTPAFMMSARHLNLVFIVDAESGRIIWESPSTMFATQHDATFLEDGRILVFDNGLFRNVPIPFFVSRAAEVDLKTNAITWMYPSEQAPATERAQFASSIMGSAQRLPNGNTLITESTANNVIEVTPQGEVVWSYTEYFRDADGPRTFFKARKYDAKGTEWGPKMSSGFGGGFCRLAGQ